MLRLIAILVIVSAPLMAAELQEDSDIKFAFYSPAWGENTNDDLRLVAHNQTSAPVRLDSIVFLKDGEAGTSVPLSLNLEIPPLGYAEVELEYIDLLQGDACVDRTMAENWRLVEISNYTLNPSVRNLIIEDTDSFRIYQCVETVLTTWTDLETDTQRQYEEWVLYHFESRRN